MEEVFQMGRRDLGRANHVAVHDGVHDHLGGGTGVFRAQILPRRSWILGGGLLESERQRDHKIRGAGTHYRTQQILYRFPVLMGIFQELYIETFENDQTELTKGIVISK